MPYNFVADGFHTKKLCTRLSSREVRFYTGNGCFAFLSHLLGTLEQRTMFALGSLEHAYTISVNKMNFLLGVTAEALRFRSNWISLTQYFRNEGVAPCTNDSFSKKLR